MFTPLTLLLVLSDPEAAIILCKLIVVTVACDRPEQFLIVGRLSERLEGQTETCGQNKMLNFHDQDIFNQCRQMQQRGDPY